nr:hypothetical protein [Aliishimia ponticola]
MSPLLLAACGEPVLTAEQLIPDYRGVDTQLLDGDLVQFRVEMTNALEPRNVAAYAECAAAGYTLVRGYGFARHVRTSVDEQNGVWTGDAVYTISPTLPEGLTKIDAEVVAANCREKGIPLV